MKIFVVTPPCPVNNEARLINTMLTNGVERVNLRHPEATSDMIRSILDDIEPSLLSRLSLHDFHDLALLYGTGIHLNGRHPVAPPLFNGTLSRSCHSIQEAADSRDLDYYFISPVFESISKPGYTPPFNLKDLRHAFECGDLDRKAVALGGITPQRLKTLSSIGFATAAVLGYIWNLHKGETITDLISTLCCNT